MGVMNSKSKFQTNGVSIIKVILTIRGKTQREAAMVLGISTASFSDKLRGNIRFSADEISTLSDFLDVSADVLLGREPLEVS